MKTVYLFRTSTSDQGTEGIVIYSGKYCYSLELPWRDNKPNISCIPKGAYEAKIRLSPRFGRVYWILEVEGRTYILIHSGNWAGREDLGYKTHTSGCILFGKYRGELQGQRAVLASRPALRQFIDTMGNEPFKLIIIEEF
jgi:hypothetical protein